MNAVCKQFKLPDVGEGLTEGEILKWHVQPGDTVTVNQTLVEVETAKAAVELPSPYAGVVTELHVDEGTTVDVGAPIITIDTEPDGPRSRAAESSPPAQSAAVHEDLVPAIPTPSDGEAVEPGLIGGPAPGGRTSVLVGYGPKIDRPPSAAPRKDSASPPRLNPTVAQNVDAATDRATFVTPRSVGRRSPARSHVLAKPPVRKLARTSASTCDGDTVRAGRHDQPRRRGGRRLAPSRAAPTSLATGEREERACRSRACAR